MAFSNVATDDAMGTSTSPWFLLAALEKRHGVAGSSHPAVVAVFEAAMKSTVLSEAGKQEIAVRYVVRRVVVFVGA